MVLYREYIEVIVATVGGLLILYIMSKNRKIGDNTKEEKVGE
jgi:hypothetical protein